MFKTPSPTTKTQNMDVVKHTYATPVIFFSAGEYTAGECKLTPYSFLSMKNARAGEYT